MSEGIEIPVTQVKEATHKASRSMFEGLRKLVLASIGAVAFTRDEAEAFVNKLVERGEIAQKDGEKLVQEVRSRLRDNRSPFQQLGERVEQRIESALNIFNIPTKRDLDELSAKIATLTERVEELRKRSE
jgi:poly(hydroxyalkanoate) granule-associated protein